MSGSANGVAERSRRSGVKRCRGRSGASSALGPALVALGLVALACERSLDLDRYSFGPGPAGTGGAAGASGLDTGASGGVTGGAPPDGSGGSKSGSSGLEGSAGAVALAGSSGDAAPSGGAPGAGGASNGGSAGGPSAPANDGAAFDHYSFTRGPAAFGIGAPGLLANDSEGALVAIASAPSEAGGRVELFADGAFSFSPPSSRFWGDDFFEYRHAGLPESRARVRVSVQPESIDLLDVQAGRGNGFVMSGSDGFGTGRRLSPAGDVNGDGLADVIVQGPALSRKAYVVFGQKGRVPLNLVDLEAQREPGFVISLLSDNVAGVAGGGDVNADGLDDLLIGADVIFGAGDVYVIFGKADLAPVVVGGAEPYSGFQISARFQNSAFGFGVAAAGDVNGDGFDDVASRAVLTSAINGAASSATIIVFGKADASVVSILDVADGVGAGFAVIGGGFPAPAGDVNGDGLDDIVGATATETLVVFGKRDVAPLQAAEIASGQGGGFALLGSGRSVSGAGDVNGDGLADIVLGPSADTLDGAASVVFGTAAPDPIAVNLLAPGAGFVVRGDALELGGAVSGAGDVNGDGLADVVFSTSGAARSPRAFLVFGKPDDEIVDVDAFNGQIDLGLTLTAPPPSADIVTPAGIISAPAGDVNADGIVDLLVGDADANDGLGAAHVLFGWDMTGSIGERELVLLGGPGDDTLVDSGAPMVCVAGGHGTDTLALQGENRVLDLTLPSSCVADIELIDLTGSGPNTVILNDAVVRRLPENRAGVPAPLARTLVVTGDADDRVIVRGAVDAYEAFGTNGDRDVYRKSGAFYGLEVRAAVQLERAP